MTDDESAVLEAARKWVEAKEAMLKADESKRAIAMRRSVHATKQNTS
jgi:hypothetical protein